MTLFLSKDGGAQSGIVEADGRHCPMSLIRAGIKLVGTVLHVATNREEPPEWGECRAWTWESETGTSRELGVERQVAAEN